MSKKILIVDDHEKFSSLCASSLEVYLAAKVIHYTDIDEAKDYCLTQKPDLVLVRSKIKDRKVDLIFSTLISENKLRVLLYVIGQSKLTIHQANIFPKDLTISDLIKSIAIDLSITAKDMAELDFGEFYSFRIDRIVMGINLVCDLYVKNNEEYSIILKKDSTFSKDVLSILDNQNVQYIFVKSIERLKFIDSQLIFLSELLAEDELSLNDQFTITNKAYVFIKDSALKMNITPEVILMTERCVSTIQSIVTKVPDLKKLMETIENSSDLNFNQSILTSFICNHLIDNIEWGTNEHKVKLTFVSFFNNITLAPHLIFINSESKLKESKIEEKERKEVLKHALDAAKIVTQFKKSIPLGVDTIIKQHHGARDGVGFNAFPQSISPLAIIFLVADEWVTYYLSAQSDGKKISRDHLLNVVKNKYRTLSFKAVLKAFEKIKF